MRYSELVPGDVIVTFPSDNTVVIVGRRKHPVDPDATILTLLFQMGVIDVSVSDLKEIAVPSRLMIRVRDLK